MSRYSGKCDFADHISFEKQIDKGNYLAADWLECFEAFKEKTGGVIHQHVWVKNIQEYNQENLKKLCPNFDFIEHKKEVPDKRSKTGFRTETYYTYTYYGKEYTQKEINKKGIYVVKDIKFNTLLDLIPYFPYVVAFCSSSDSKETVFISDNSFVDEEENDLLKAGFVSYMSTFYKQELSKLYLEVCKNYFLYDLENRTKIVPVGELHHCIIECKEDNTCDEHYFFEIDDEVDYMHDVEYVWKDGKVHEHWSSPKGFNNAIRLSTEDVENFLKEDIKAGNIMIKYVAKPKEGFPKLYS